MEILASKRYKRRPSTFNHLDYYFHHYKLVDTGSGCYWVTKQHFYLQPTYIQGYLLPHTRKEMLRQINGTLYKCVIFKDGDLTGVYYQ